MAFPAWCTLLAVDLHAILDNAKTDIFKLQRNGTGNGKPNIKDTITKTL